MKQTKVKHTNEWIKLYNEGHSFHQIAKEYNVAMTTVKRRIANYVKIKPKSKYMQYAQEWLNLLNSGMKKSDIARKYDVSPSTVGSILSKIGVERNGNKKFLHLVDDMKQLYASGLSLKEISDKLNLSTQAIANYLELEGVNRRPYTKACRNYEIYEDLFESIDSSKKAFLLGIIWVVGNVVYDSQKPRNIRFVTTDENLISIVVSSLYKHDIEVKSRKSDNTFRKDIQCLKLMNDLIKLGFSNKGNKQVPEFKDSALRIAFIDGLLYSRLVFPKNKAHVKSLDKPLVQMIANYFIEDLNVDARYIKGFCENENSTQSNYLTIFKKDEIEKLRNYYDEIIEKYSLQLSVDTKEFA